MENTTGMNENLLGELWRSHNFFRKVNKSLVVPPAQVGVIHTHRAQGGSQSGSPDFGNSSPFPQGSSVCPQQIPRFSQQTWGEFYFNFCGFFFSLIPQGFGVFVVPLVTRWI